MTFMRTLAELDPIIPRHEEYGPNSLDELGHKDYLDGVERLIKNWQELPWGTLPNIGEATYSNAVMPFAEALRAIQRLSGADSQASAAAVKKLERAHFQILKELGPFAQSLRDGRDEHALDAHVAIAQDLVARIEQESRRASSLADDVAQRVLNLGLSDHAIAYTNAAKQHGSSYAKWLRIGAALWSLAVAWVVAGLVIVQADMSPALIGVTTPSWLLAGAGTFAFKRASTERNNQVRNERDGRLLQTHEEFYNVATEPADKSRIVADVARALTRDF